MAIRTPFAAGITSTRVAVVCAGERRMRRCRFAIDSAGALCICVATRRSDAAIDAAIAPGDPIYMPNFAVCVARSGVAIDRISAFHWVGRFFSHLESKKTA
jgi:hypothetical protein